MTDRREPNVFITAAEGPIVRGLRSVRGREATERVIRRLVGEPPTPAVCDPNALTGCCRWDHDHEEETP